nr:unnamed protein product [Callosobruchus analis]
MEEKNVHLYYKIDVLEQKLSNYDNMDASCCSKSTNDDQMSSTRGAIKPLGRKPNARSLSSHMEKKPLPEPAPTIEVYQTRMTPAEPSESTGSASSSTTARRQLAVAVETPQNYANNGVVSQEPAPHAGHVNIRWLLPSLNHVEELLTTVQLDILGISETWLTSSVLNDEIEISGFSFLRADRGSRGGGVGTYVRSGLQVKTIEIEETTEKLEQIWFSLKINQINISCGILYRPPASSITDALDVLNNTLSNIISISDEVVIMGDLNIDLCKINNYTDLFNSTLETFDLNQIVIEPTRCCGKSSSLLDVIALTNIDALLGPVTHVDLHEVTDHQLSSKN